MAYNQNRSYNFSPYAHVQQGQRFGQSMAFNNFKRSGGSGWNAKPARRSQCKTITKGNTLYVTGWKVGRKAGFRTFFVAPAKSGKTVTSKSGKVWHACRVTVVNKTHGSNGLFPAWIDEATKKVFIKDLGLMLNPNTGFISYIPRKK